MLAPRPSQTVGSLFCLELQRITGDICNLRMIRQAVLGSFMHEGGDLASRNILKCEEPLESSHCLQAKDVCNGSVVAGHGPPCIIAGDTATPVAKPFETTRPTLRATAERMSLTSGSSTEE